MYKCSICGKEFDKAIDRANCEINCTKRLEAEIKKVEEAKKKEEQNARHDEVTKAIDGALYLLNKYMSDYGTYTYDGKNAHMLDDFIPTKYLHHFLF